MGASVYLHGNVTKDCEIRMAGDSPIVAFSLATNYRKKIGSEWQNVPTFWRCEFWGSRAKALSDHIVKGREFIVIGEGFMDKWTGSDGIEHEMLKVNVDRMEFAGKAPEGSGHSEHQGSSKPAQQTKKPATDDFPDDLDF